MDKTSTQELDNAGAIIRQALKKQNFPKPGAVSLEFIRNFARNFRVQKEVEGDIREFVLN